MNPRIRKVIDEIERTKAKIAELQTLLPELERKRIDMENTEIVKLVRSADIQPADLPAFIESLKAPKVPAPAPAPIVQHEGADSRSASAVALNGSAPGEEHRPGQFVSDGEDTEEYPDDGDNWDEKPPSED